MDKITIAAVAAAAAGGGYLLWRWYTAATTPYGGDGAGNPPGTGYDSQGNATPPPGDGLPGEVWNPESGQFGNWGGAQGGLFWKWSPEMWRDAFTVPAGVDGGLRADPRSDNRDARSGLSYGILAMPLGAHDSHIFVYDGPMNVYGGWANFQGIGPAVQPNRFDDRDRVMRIHICEEPIVVRMVTRPGTHNGDAYNEPFMQWAGDAYYAGSRGRRPPGVRCPGTAWLEDPNRPERRNTYPCEHMSNWLAHGRIATLEILARPNMPNWGPNATGPAHRIWDTEVADADRDGTMATQQQRWAFYDVDDPVYDMLRPSSGQPEWVTEHERNCSHWANQAVSGYPHLKYNPYTNGCDPMNAEEIQDWEADQDRVDQAAEQVATDRSLAAEALSQELYGVSCEEADRWEHPTPRLTQDEKDARRLSMYGTREEPGRMAGRWAWALDLPDAFTNSLQLLINRGWGPGEQIREARRIDGGVIYRGLAPLMKREFRRDYAALDRTERIAAGGPYAFAMIWLTPPSARPIIGQATTSKTGGRYLTR